MFSIKRFNTSFLTRFVRYFIIPAVLASGALSDSLMMYTKAAHANTYDARNLIASGQTQVIAKIGKREFTISELRIELSRLGITEVTPEAERLALQGLINRHLLASQARSKNIHRQPEAIMRVEAAKNQALADYYLRAASHPPEPTLQELDDYIAAHPGLFTDRTEYDFSVVTLKSDLFRVEEMTALFSETADFSALERLMETEEIAFEKSNLTQPSSQFPRDIRTQLRTYGINDNIVLQDGKITQILKIIGIRPAPLPKTQWLAIARRLFLEEAAIKRAQGLMDGLKAGHRISYFRKSLAPIPVTSASPSDERVGK